MVFDCPSQDTFEITIIGTGGGYGESCIIHLGNKNWVIIDSCSDLKTKHPLPLDYLEKIGVNVQSDIKLIVCSHWHDDHIRGISKILKLSESALFSYAKNLNGNKFFQMLGLDNNKESQTSRTKEFNSCLETIDIREEINKSIVCKTSYPDRLLFATEFNEESLQVISLSPSDEDIKHSEDEMMIKYNDFALNNKAIPLSDNNKKSVVLLIKVGVHNAILGADLENFKNNKLRGWEAIVTSSTFLSNKSSYIKLPHHGSENAFSENLWKNHLIQFPTSTLTPFSKLKTPIPTIPMLKHYLNKTDNLYTTSLNNNLKKKKRPKNIESLIRDLKIELSEIPYNYGVIRSRINIFDKQATWHTDFFGDACKICEK